MRFCMNTTGGVPDGHSQPNTRLREKSMSWNRDGAIRLLIALLGKRLPIRRTSLIECITNLRRCGMIRLGKTGTGHGFPVKTKTI